MSVDDPKSIRPDVRIVEFDAIDSTNAEAMRRAASGERGPLWLRADQQLAGRGRSGRAWSSPTGNLSATYLFAPRCPLSCLSQISLVAGIALFDAAAEAIAGAANPVPGNPVTASPIPASPVPASPVSAGLRLKWPNDLLMNDAKLAGILIETSHFGVERVTAIGCGLNIATLPPVSGRPVARLADAGVETTPAAFLHVLAAGLERWLEVWSEGAGFPAIRAAWLERAMAPGTPADVHAGEGKTSGVFRGIDDEGALLLEDHNGNVRRFHYGDVTNPGESPPSPERPG